MTSEVEPSHALLVEALPRIERIVASYARRHRLAPEDAEELAGDVKLKLLADNCAVLRKFEGRSTLESYLTTVTHRLLLDQRTAELGRWRPSAGARDLGATGIELEQEIDRDGRTVDQAVTAIATRRGLPVAEVAAVAQRLPVRGLGRSRVADGVDPDVLASAAPDPEALTVAADLHHQRAQIHQALAASLDALAPAHRLALRLRFAEGLEIGAIADLLGEPRRPFYRTFERILSGLRGELEARNVSPAAVRQLLDLGDLGARESLSSLGTGRDSLEKPASCPSSPSTGDVLPKSQ